MGVKEYLSQIRYIDRDIQSRVEEKQALRSAIEIKTTSYNNDKVQESGVGRFDDSYSKYIEVSEAVNKKIDELIQLKLRVSNEIDLIDKSEYRILLRMRYINLKSFEEIAVFMSYDIRQIHRLHGNALQNFEKMSLNVIECH